MDKFSLNRFFLNESTDSERKHVIDWLLDPENDLVVRKWMNENWDLICSLDLQNHPDNPDEEKIWLSIQSKIKEAERTKISLHKADIPVLSFFRHHIKKIASVAAIFIIVFSGITFLTNYHQPKKNSSAVLIQDIAPPKENNAILTLSDGRKIYIDSITNGSIASQGNVNIIKKNKDEIHYNGPASGTITYNTLSLPKGSKPIRLVLADGSLVWLNAASSITFPTAFNGNSREVSLKGEGYFEIVKNIAMPFKVHVNTSSGNKGLVEVLGTHFNINSYEDEENIKATLLEGSVNISIGKATKILRPGEQAQLSGKNIKVLTDIDIDDVMAWKNQQFYFSGTDIKTIMRQVEKYYNVEIEYQDNIPYKFVAKISRQVNVTEFLKKLELTNLIHFEIKGNKIIVKK